MLLQFYRLCALKIPHCSLCSSTLKQCLVCNPPFAVDQDGFCGAHVNLQTILTQEACMPLFRSALRSESLSGFPGEAPIAATLTKHMISRHSVS